MGFIRSALIHCGLSLALKQVAAQTNCPITGLIGPAEISASSAGECWNNCNAKEVNGVGFIPDVAPSCNPATDASVMVTGALRINTNSAGDRFDMGFGVGRFSDLSGVVCDVYGFLCDDANVDGQPGDICADLAQMESLFEGVTFEVPCVLDADGRVVIDFCVSWKTAGVQNDVCLDEFDIFPDPGPKCDCGEVTVPNCPAGVSLSVGEISVSSGTFCNDPTYEIPIDGLIPVGFTAVFVIKDATGTEVTGTSTNGNVISADLASNQIYSIEVTLTEVVNGVTLECPSIILQVLLPICCENNPSICPLGQFCCPDEDVCKIGVDELTACGDPHMTGFLGQKFDFTGEDGKWYALIADDNMNVNMRVSCPVADLSEITYITGLSVLTTDDDGFDHSIVIEVKEPHNLESSCPAGVSPCLADGSLRVVVDGEETLLAPGTVSLGGGVEISAANLPGACRSFGFEKYWERKKLEYAAHARRLGESLTMAEWILGDPTATNMAECEEYVARAEAGEGGLFAHQSEHASFQIRTPHATVRLSHGKLHQIAMRDPTDQYDLPDHLTWQMNVGVDHNQVSHDAAGILGETFVPTRDADGKPIMSGMGAIRGTQEDYRVGGALEVGFVQNAHTS